MTPFQEAREPLRPEPQVPGRQSPNHLFDTIRHILEMILLVPRRAQWIQHPPSPVLPLLAEGILERRRQGPQKNGVQRHRNAGISLGILYEEKGCSTASIIYNANSNKSTVSDGFAHFSAAQFSRLVVERVVALTLSADSLKVHISLNHSVFPDLLPRRGTAGGFVATAFPLLLLAGTGISFATAVLPVFFFLGRPRPRRG